MNNETLESKRPYNTPQLVRHGNVRDLTQHVFRSTSPNVDPGHSTFRTT